MKETIKLIMIGIFPATFLVCLGIGGVYAVLHFFGFWAYSIVIVVILILVLSFLIGDQQYNK